MRHVAADAVCMLMQRGMNELASADWVTATAGLNTLRRLAVHHADTCRPLLCALLLAFHMKCSGPT